MPETVIASFVVRFMLDQEMESSKVNWRGVIRHIQTNEQLNFAGMEEALEFIQRYVKIQPGLPPPLIECEG